MLTSVSERGFNPLQCRKAGLWPGCRYGNGEGDFGEGAEVGEARVGRASNYSQAVVGRSVTIADISHQLLAKKDNSELIWYATPSSKREPYFAHSC